MPLPPLPTLQASDPAADGSRWAVMRTALPQVLLQRFWLAWSIAALISAAASAVVIFVILSRPKLRSQTLNKFIVGLTLPDILFSILCSCTCFGNYIHHGWLGADWMCAAQSTYSVYGFAASMWMNAMIARELHRMASSAVRAEAYHPLSAPVACAYIAAVHAGALLLACVPLLPGLPAHFAMQRGLACLPTESDLESTIFHWVFVLDLVFIMPCILLLWYAWRVYRLLTHEAAERGPDGDTPLADRALFWFFARLLLAFLGMWLPSGVFIWLCALEGTTGSYLAFFGGLMSHLQGFVSALLCMRKADVWDELWSWNRQPESYTREGLPPPQGAGPALPVADDTVVKREDSFITGQSVEAMIQQLSAEIMESIRLRQQEEMWVIEYATWFAIRHFPRSSERVSRSLRTSDSVIFISHRWWSDDKPDNDEGIKYGLLCRGIKRLVARHRLCRSHVVVWCDWACIDQDDPAKQLRGIASLITYAARSMFVLIPVSPDAASVRSFCEVSHPMDLHNYGERAWCRLETYIFMCVSEMQQRPAYCYGFGAAAPPGAACWGLLRGRRERLRPLVRTTAGASFDLSRLPSSGTLTVEADRCTIRDIEEDMCNMYVHKAILEQSLKLAAGSRARVCRLQEKQVRSQDVPRLASSIFAKPTASRVVALHLEGNLIGARGALLIMQDIVCAPHTTGLAMLGLSNNPQLGAEGVEHIARGLTHAHCRLVTLTLGSCRLDGAAVASLVEHLPAAGSLWHLDLSRNLIDEAACELLLEACGGCDAPVVTLNVEGNPLQPAVFRKALRARAVVELGRRCSSRSSSSERSTCSYMSESSNHGTSASLKQGAGTALPRRPAAVQAALEVAAAASIVRCPEVEPHNFGPVEEELPVPPHVTHAAPALWSRSCQLPSRPPGPGQGGLGLVGAEFEDRGGCAFGAWAP